MRLAEVEGACSFLWSSDGRVIAVADRQEEGSPAYRRLRLMAADGSDVRTVREDDWVLGFFWEPQGTRLAWVALNSEERTHGVADCGRRGNGGKRRLGRSCGEGCAFRPAGKRS